MTDAPSDRSIGSAIAAMTHDMEEAAAVMDFERPDAARSHQPY
jgi:hypothetical protein